MSQQCGDGAARACQAACGVSAGLAALWLFASAAGLSASPGARVQVSRATVLGRIVEYGTDRPLSNAFVEIAPVEPGGQEPIRLLTAASGRFAVGLPSRGAYTVRVQAAGYYPASFGQLNPSGPSGVLRVEAGQPPYEITIRMWRAAVITGTLRDAFGDPAPRVRVEARSVQGLRRGDPAAASAETDDQGRFRLPGLLPSRYVVAVARTSRSADPALPVVLCPGTSVAADATIVALQSGDVQDGADCWLPLDRGFAVDGQVREAGDPVPKVTATLVQDSPGGIIVASTQTDAQGAFRFAGVPMGNYFIDVVRNAAPPRPGEPGAASGRASVSVSGGVSDVLVAIVPGGVVRGQVRFAGDRLKPDSALVGRMRIVLYPLGERGRPVTLVVDRDGTVEAQSLPIGDYIVSVASAPPAWSLLSVSGDIPARDDVIVGVESGRSHTIVVTMTGQAGRVSGFVSPAPGIADPAQVVLLPQNWRDWVARGRLSLVMRVVVAEANGGFAFEGLRAGRYLAVALAAERMVTADDEKAIEAVAAVASPVLVSGSGVMVSLSLRPWR